VGEQLCNGTCVDVTSSVAHCGGCNPCPAGVHSSTTCASSTCGWSCSSGFGDCSAATDGCETDTNTDLAHCGACNQPCTAGTNQTASCNGSCNKACVAGFFDLGGGKCGNYVGAWETFPASCPGCEHADTWSGGCACPGGTAELAVAVESDCSGFSVREATDVRLCYTAGQGASADFGGAFQWDDVAGWCGAPTQCRVPNPYTGDCSCPSGSAQNVVIRSIIRLPCDGLDAGTTITVCGNSSAPFTSYAGSYQDDDSPGGRVCRATNPWTGACSCPSGSVDQSYRVMVDGGLGIYGSLWHVCSL
jgi:hypothetical protein